MILLYLMGMIAASIWIDYYERLYYPNVGFYPLLVKQPFYVRIGIHLFRMALWWMPFTAARLALWFLKDKDGTSLTNEKEFKHSDSKEESEKK